MTTTHPTSSRARSWRKTGLPALALAAVIGLPALPQAMGAEETRDEKVRKDLASHGESGLWIYNDLNRGLEQARQSGRPLLVVLRCVP